MLPSPRCVSVLAVKVCLIRTVTIIFIAGCQSRAILLDRPGRDWIVWTSTVSFLFRSFLQPPSTKSNSTRTAAGSSKAFPPFCTHCWPQFTQLEFHNIASKLVQATQWLPLWWTCFLSDWETRSQTTHLFFFELRIKDLSACPSRVARTHANRRMVEND